MVYHPNANYDYSAFGEGLEHSFGVAVQQPWRNSHCKPTQAPMTKLRTFALTNITNTFNGPHLQTNTPCNRQDAIAEPSHRYCAQPSPVEPSNVAQKSSTRSDTVFAHDFHVPSLLTNQTLHVHVAQYSYSIPIPGHPITRYETKVSVNGQQVLVPDLPTRNGALHVISNLIHPLKHRRHGMDGERVGDADMEDWEDWEEWLPRWADEN